MLGPEAAHRKSSSDWITGAPPEVRPRRVVVTGMGLVTPLGVGVSTVWPALLSGATGVRALRPEDLPEVCLAVGLSS